MDRVDDTVGYQDRLTENFYQFSRYLVAEDYVDSLVESEVLSIDDRELILNRFTNQTRRQRAVKFIEVLMTRGPTGYKKFLELLEYQCPHVYETVTKKKPRQPPPDFQRNRYSDRLRLINELPNLAQHIKDQFAHNVELDTQLSFFQQLLELSKDEKTELESEIEGLKKVEQENYSLKSRVTDLQNEIYEQQSAMNNVMQRYLNCMEERDKAKEKCHMLQLKNDELYKQRGPEGFEAAASPPKRSNSEKHNRPSTVPPKPMPLPKPKSKLDLHQQKQEHVQARQNIIADELEMYKGQCEDLARQLGHADTELNRTEELYNRSQKELSRLKETSGILERQLKEAKAKHETDYKTIQEKCKDITELHMERLKEATRLTEITRENTEMRQHVHELEKENEKLKWQLERSNLERTNLQNTHSGTGSQGSPAQAIGAPEDKSIQNLRDGPTHYRKLIRSNQLATAIRREAKLATKGRTRYRRFSLGIVGLEFDEDILGITGKKANFNYKDGTISDMDTLLGDKWDVFATEGVIQFVTQLSLWFTKEGYLSGSVRTAVCRESIRQLYREQLQSHIYLNREVHEESDDEDQTNV